MDLNTFKDLGMIVALTLGLTQVTKSFISDTRFYPLISLVVAVGLTLLIMGVSTLAVLIGIVAGLSASGLYDHAATVLKS